MGYKVCKDLGPCLIPITFLIQVLPGFISSYSTYHLPALRAEFIINFLCWGSEISLCVKVLVAKCVDLSSIPGTHVVKWKNWLVLDFLWASHPQCVKYTYTHNTINAIFIISFLCDVHCSFEAYLAMITYKVLRNLVSILEFST